jgi:hypothetical protein
MSGKVFGILKGYLPFQGILELEHYSGSISTFNFSPYLSEVLKANPPFFLHLIGKQICISLDDFESVESLHENENSKSFD